MPFILNRADNRLVQYTPRYTLQGSLVEMKGKYVLDTPEDFDLSSYLTEIDLSDNVTTKNLLKGFIQDKYLDHFPGYEVYSIHHLETTAEFDSLFDPSASFPSVDAGAFLTCSYKVGDTPDSVCVRGRTPQQNVLEGGVRITDITSPSNRCLVSKEINVGGPSGSAKREFRLYYRDCVKVYTKDSTDLSGTASDAPTTNRTGNLEYEIAPENFLRAYISSDGGNTYTEIRSLERFVFSSPQFSVRVAFVNPHNVDVHLLAYTLMY
jgi:hypothetical protein